MKIMIGNPVPKRFKRKDRGMPISNWFASSPRIALLTSESSIADSSTTVVNSRTVWHHALFDDQGGDDGADGGPEDGEIVE
jgi:hypothetical protein